jgi:hypothetical protein
LAAACFIGFCLQFGGGISLFSQDRTNQSRAITARKEQIEFPSSSSGFPLRLSFSSAQSALLLSEIYSRVMFVSRKRHFRSARLVAVSLAAFSFALAVHDANKHLSIRVYMYVLKRRRAVKILTDLAAQWSSTLQPIREQL